MPIIGLLAVLAVLILTTVVEARLPNTRMFCKSAITGHFVSEHFAKRHPKTTICQTR